ncbi:MAG TPA: hypothetical protein DCZ41_02000 [Firmicutes bacterium]|nr:hypothetical protein [Bacillota bacterium]
MEPINELHPYLAKFIDIHSGFSRNLQRLVILFLLLLAFEKTKAFIERAAKKRTKLRYRD